VNLSLSVFWTLVALAVVVPVLTVLTAVALFSVSDFGDM